jgi:hypothetical protein
MRKIKNSTLLVLIVAMAFVNTVNAQDLDGYKLHETDQNVFLYIKATDQGIIFKALNKRDKEINVRINNVVYTTEYGNVKSNDVLIRWVYPNKASNGGVSSYGKIMSWKFDSWEWTEKSF